MSEREDLTFRSGDADCAAWLYRPEHASAPVPCVVMAHGFTATRGDRLPAYAERFAAAGIAALVFDYRHFGASGGQPRQLLDIGRQLDDYRAAIAFAKGLEGIDPTRIALFGSSFSGGHVITVAAGDPSIAAVVSQAPFADGLPTVLAVGARNAIKGTLLGIADQAAALAGRRPRTMPAVGPPGSFAAMTAPEAQPGFASITAGDGAWRNEVAARVMLHIGQYRPVAKAPKVHCPVLVCVCDRDETTPPGPAAKMGAKAPHGEVVHYPIGHFDVYTGADFERAVSDQTAFLRRHLLGVPAAATAAA